MTGNADLWCLGCLLVFLAIIGGLPFWPVPGPHPHRATPTPTPTGGAVRVVLPRVQTEHIFYPNRADELAEQAAFAAIVARFDVSEETSR